VIVCCAAAQVVEVKVVSTIAANQANRCFMAGLNFIMSVEGYSPL
jgi:hypothetical protein